MYLLFSCHLTSANVNQGTDPLRSTRVLFSPLLNVYEDDEPEDEFSVLSRRQAILASQFNTCFIHATVIPSLEDCCKCNIVIFFVMNDCPQGFFFCFSQCSVTKAYQGEILIHSFIHELMYSKCFLGLQGMAQQPRAICLLLREVKGNTQAQFFLPRQHLRGLFTQRQAISTTLVGTPTSQKRFQMISEQTTAESQLSPVDCFVQSC